MTLPMTLAGRDANERASCTPAMLKAWLYRYGREGARDKIVLLASDRCWSKRCSSAEWRRVWERLERIDEPSFPIKGKDLLGLGLAGLSAGEELGRLLRLLEDWWAEKDFAPDGRACLAQAETLWQRRRCKH